MKLRDAICPFFFIALCAALFFKWKDDKWDHVPSDPGKQERDSLNAEQLFQARLAEAKVAWTDSVHNAIDSMIAHAPPAQVIYLQAYDEALSMAVADKYRFMGQWPVDTAVSGHAE